MTKKELLKWSKEYLEKNRIIDFPEDIFKEINEDSAKFIVEVLGARTMMKLPAKEIKFFEWLKENDPPVWNDLWKDEEEEPYVVALNFLPLLLEEFRGFPICDLLENDNYYFAPGHMVDHESKMMIDSVKERYKAKKQLTVEQTLVLEASIAAIDIWRFCYRYNIKIDRAKKAVDNLVDEGVLVHLKDAEHLAHFIDW